MAETTLTSGSANFGKLKLKLRELFELDKADLDFGIYRILRQRHKEITEFLDEYLERTVRDALQSHTTLQRTQLEDELRKAEVAAREAGFDPGQSPRVQELRAKSAAGNASLEALADEVYSHLLTFFSRYYSEGDFLGLQRSSVHGYERYMIPYNGEEVKLVWANMDQYYIKSSDLLRDYSFRLRPRDFSGEQLDFGEQHDEVTIHFKLVDDQGNEKPKLEGKTARAFALDSGQPVLEVENGIIIRFRYEEHLAERDLQKKLNIDTEKTLADNLPLNWKRLLFADDPTYTGKEKQTRTILQKHLRSYTAKYQFDYFIHKDLGGFLRRELDAYIKNEVMHLDDIQEESAPKADEYLSKIGALRKCGLPLIRMLEQLENFQRKLWLKKKFVVETGYCLTLDRVPETLYEEICANEAQWTEWEELYAISEVEPDLLKPQTEVRNAHFLKANPLLMVDTRNFDPAFTLKLLASIHNLDQDLHGVCVYSENFQALQLIQERYQQQFRYTYIDPPYNTASSEILYKNNYKSSSWSSLIDQSIRLSRDLMTLNGVMCATIDDEQQKELSFILSETFGDPLGTVCIRINPSGRVTLRGFAQAHEYAIFVGRSSEALIGKMQRSKEQEQRFNRSDDRGVFEWRNFRREGSSSDRASRPKRYFPLYVKGDSFRVPRMEWNDESSTYDVLEILEVGEEEVYPIDSDGNQRVWRWGIDRIARQGYEIVPKRRNGNNLQIYYKYRPNKAGVLPLTIWIDKKYSATEYGTGTLKKLFGNRNVFDFPKSIYAVEDCLRIGSTGDAGAIILDFFAGSGTTGHAVIRLNREDSGSRKYVLIDVGQHFNTVLVPRLKKVVYSDEWKDGKPATRNSGASHAFKVIRLESYEDTLNNLRLQQSHEQETSVKNSNEQQQDEYLLGYLLDVESSGSASLLDLERFRDPFSYKLNIANSSAGQTTEKKIDLVETFNWLIGLKVKHVDAQKGFLTVTGEKRAGGRCLVIWRTLSDDPIIDNEALDKYLLKLEINPADTEFDFIYVNGSHTLSDPHEKIHLIEEEFQRRMFESESFESLS